MALAVAVVTAGGGAHDLGLAMASSVLALLACSLFGGVWADRLQPKRVMVVSDLIRLLCAAGMAAMFAAGGYHLLPLCLLAALSSGAGSFFNPAMAALRPLLVPADRRQSANATFSMLQTGSSVVGPALGGLVVAAFGDLVAVLVGALIGWSGLFFFDVAWETAVQDQVPHQALGRVASWDYLLSFLAMPLGNALAGPLAGAFGVDEVIAAGAAVLLLAGLSQMFVPGVRRLTRTSPDPVPAPAEAVTA